MNAMYGKDVLDALERDAWEHRLIALWEGLSFDERAFIQDHAWRQYNAQQSNAQLSYLNALQPMTQQQQQSYRGSLGLANQLLGGLNR